VLAYRRELKYNNQAWVRGEAMFKGVTSALACVAASMALAAAGSASAGSAFILASSINPSQVGQNTTLTMSIDSGVCAGVPVTFTDNATPLTCTGGTQQLSAGNPAFATCVVSFATPGVHTLQAFTPSTGPCANNQALVPLTQNVSNTAPTLAQWAEWTLVALLMGGGLLVMARRNRSIAAF
jgi:hypothetical protein